MPPKIFKKSELHYFSIKKSVRNALVIKTWLKLPPANTNSNEYHFLHDL